MIRVNDFLFVNPDQIALARVRAPRHVELVLSSGYSIDVHGDDAAALQELLEVLAGAADL